MSQHEQQRGCFPAGRASPSGTGCPGRPPPQPGTGRSRARPGFAGLWLLLIPAACCGGPLLIAGLAAVGTLAWGGLGLAVAAVLAGALLAIQRYRRARAGSGASDKSQNPSWPPGRFGHYNGSGRSPATADMAFPSATECERHPDLAGSDHRLMPRPSPRVSGGGYRLTCFGSLPTRERPRNRAGYAACARRSSILVGLAQRPYSAARPFW